MTAYAISSKDTAAGALTLDIKSVNSRFLDIQFRMHDDLRFIEPLLREAITARITRGKIDCRLSLHKQSSNDVSPSALNIEKLEQLIGIQHTIHSHYPNVNTLSVNEILQWPGILSQTSLSQDTLQQDILAMMTEVLDALLQARLREGIALRETLLTRLNSMQEIVTEITPIIPEVIAQFQQKVAQRIQEAFNLNVQNNATITQEEIINRATQEATLYGIRIDVSEELSRLNTHIYETRSILQKGGAVGKRLDFMMQELNREANTLGAKAPIKKLSDASMELKLLIEQIREQVQNLA